MGRELDGCQGRRAVIADKDITDQVVASKRQAMPPACIQSVVHETRKGRYSHPMRDPVASFSSLNGAYRLCVAVGRLGVQAPYWGQVCAAAGTACDETVTKAP